MEIDNVIDSFNTLSVDNQTKPIGVYDPVYSEKGWMEFEEKNNTQTTGQNTQMVLKTNHGSNQETKGFDKDLNDLTYMFGNINTFKSVVTTNFLGYPLLDNEQTLYLRKQHHNFANNYYDVLDGILQGTCYYGYSLITSIKNYFTEYLGYACRKDFSENPFDYCTYDKIKQMIEIINNREYKNDIDELAIIRDSSEILNLIVLAESR